MFVPLTPEQVEGAVKGAVKGGAEVATDVFTGWWKWRKRSAWIKSVTGQLNEMFANPEYAWRGINVLATAFDDDPPFTLTREALRGLHSQSVRRDIGGKSIYFKKNNWKLTAKGLPVKGPDGRYILADGVPEGLI